MSRNRNFFAAIFSALVLLPNFAMLSRAQTLAATPPMGWNSWDAYGLTIDEADFKANATVLAGVAKYGWKYAVIDEGWYMANTDGKTLEEKKYLWDQNGLLIPIPGRFPSSERNQGFKPMADWVHAQGLKFGIHIVRGIPKQVVDANLPIAGSSFHALDAADKTSPCPWDEGNWVFRTTQPDRLITTRCWPCMQNGDWISSRWIASVTTRTGPLRSARFRLRFRRPADLSC